jgi:DNA-directed RNA polymerase subunit RPC12/RpoP
MMATAKMPAEKRVFKIVNPVTHVKKIVKPPKKKGGKPIVLYSMTMVCSPQFCPHCGTKVIAQVDGSYKCPHCGYAFNCKTCSQT